MALGDTSWVTTVNYYLLRKSLGTSDFDKDDGSYLRLSLGEFFAQRSEALGCLGGGKDVKRVSMKCAESDKVTRVLCVSLDVQAPRLDKLL